MRARVQLVAMDYMSEI